MKKEFSKNYHQIAANKVDNKIVSLTLFAPIFHFYTPLKTSENLRFSDVFRGYRNETLA